jgi:IS30 family transposase
MKYPTRIYCTEADKSLMWDRWENGESLNSIGRHFGRIHSSIQNILSQSGGIRPPRSLSLIEREEISRGVVVGQSLRSIAVSLGRAPSTISREIRRNGGRRRYRANIADTPAWDRTKRPKTCKLVENPAQTRKVEQKLKQLSAPEQIAGWLKRTYPNNEKLQVSHETIYKILFIQARGALKKELLNTFVRLERCVVL